MVKGNPKSIGFSLKKESDSCENFRESPKCNCGGSYRFNPMYKCDECNIKRSLTKKELIDFCKQILEDYDYQVLNPNPFKDFIF